MVFYFIFLIIFLSKINAFLIISLDILNVDDCVTSIYKDNDPIFINQNCKLNDNYKNYFHKVISYDIGQSITIEVFDQGGGHCNLQAEIKVYNYMEITINEKEFWSCSDCQTENIFDEDYPNLLCYRSSDRSNENKLYHFNFKIDTFKQIDLDMPEYYYYLNEKNYYFIYSPNLYGKINLIDLSLSENLYIKINKINAKLRDYAYVYYKLFFDEYFNYQGKFFGSDDSNDDKKINNGNYLRITYKKLSYELSDEERKNNGVHIKLRIGIFHIIDEKKKEKRKQVSALQEFNFFVCPGGHMFCDIETSMKCLKEGYYQINNKYYSCYETCKKCDKFGKPNTADYFNNYCDECKDEYQFFVKKEENNIEYLSCYSACPLHCPELKNYENTECVSYCPRYKKCDGQCVDSCDYEKYKYLLPNEKICYNYIPENFFIYIDNYNECYYNTTNPIIKLGDKCPDDLYDSSFDNFCINSDEDIFHFIKNPNKLINYNNPLMKKLTKKKFVIRAYTTNKKLEYIDNDKDKFIQIDISLCKKKLKSSYGFNEEKSLIFLDEYNIEEKKYLYRAFTKEGTELDYTLCQQEDIIIKEIIYKTNKPLNEDKCPKEFPYFLIEENQCLKNCDILSFLNKSCITDYITEENQINNINNIKKAIEEHSIDDLLDNIINGGNDIIIDEKNIKYQLSSSQNQNINNANISNINLGNCENILKEKYNITTDSLLIFILDIDMEGYSAPTVEYQIYNPKTKEKLILKYCEDEKISLSIPVTIDENELIKYNPKSEFYNDICSTYTTNFKTDITLKDRQKEFLNKNMTLCESNCNYAFYNYTLKKVECECDVKYRIKNLYEIKIDTDKLKSNLNFKNLINIKVLKCYKKLFNKNALHYNIGSYIILSIIFLYIVSLIYLIFKDYSSLKKEIKKLFIQFQTNNNKNEIRFKKAENIYNSIQKKVPKYITNKKMPENDFEYPPPIFKLLLKYKNLYKKSKMMSDPRILIRNRNKNIEMITQSNSSLKILKKIPEINLTEFELNNTSYIKALLYDKRTFCQYFFSLLKFEHLLFFAIIPSKDYNSKSIKICIFLFSFALFFADNAIFMNEDAIHNIYENQGNFDIIYQIPQIIYSNIISFIIDELIRFLSLSRDDVINEKKKQKIKIKNNKKFFRVLIIKYIFFFEISFLFLVFFWFYISCFCFVYRNTQIFLIKDTLFSFGLSLIISFIFYFISAILRIYSLKNRNRNVTFILSKLILF